MTTGELSEEDLVSRLRMAGCVFAEDEARILLASGADAAQLARMAASREAGEPLEHIVGWAEFAGRRFHVGPGVFVPRRRSELLVREAAARAQADARVVDLCCGCGAIGVAIAAAVATPELHAGRTAELHAGGTAELHAVDVDPAAVGWAERNVAEVGGTAYLGSLYEPLPHRLRGSVDVLVANAPYVPTDKIALMPPEARLHEPRTALDGGADGLRIQREIIAGAPSWLAAGGVLLIETSGAQASLTLAAMRRAGLSAEVVRDDDLDATIAVGRMGSVTPARSRCPSTPSA